MTGVVSVPSPRRIAGREVGDEVLVERIRSGDDRAFEALYERYQPRIAAYVRGMVRDHARAEDITQEVFLNALRRLRATDSTIVFRPWIYEIAKNACIDAHRRFSRAQEVSYDADDSLGPADQGKLVSPRAVPETVEARESLDNLQGAIGALSESHADVLVLRELEGLSYREIGERLGMSRASVESTLFRARKRLEAEYQDLVSGERCRQIQAAFDSMHGGRVRLRDRRQVSRHLAWCQACRHQARLAGLDIEVSERIPLRTKVGALLPIPAFIRERLMRSAISGQGLTGAGDPLFEWGRAAAAAAIVAVAGLGAGSVVGGGPVVDAQGAPRAAQSSSESSSAAFRRVSTLIGGSAGSGSGAFAPVSLPGGAPTALGAPVAAGPLAPQGGALPAAAGGGALPAGAGQAAGAVAGAAGGAVGHAAGAASGAVAGLGQTVAGTVGSVTQTAGGAVRGVTQTAGGTVRGVTQTAGGTVRGATQTTGGAVRGVTRTAGGVVRDVTTNPANVGGAVDNAVRGTTRTAGETVRGTTETVGGTVRTTTQTVTGTVRGTTGTVGGTVQGTTGTVGQAVQGVTQTTQSAVQGVVGAVTKPAAPATTQAAPAPVPAPAPTQSTNPVGQVVQNTTTTVGGLLGGR